MTVHVPVVVVEPDRSVSVGFAYAATTAAAAELDVEEGRGLQGGGDGGSGGGGVDTSPYSANVLRCVWGSGRVPSAPFVRVRVRACALCPFCACEGQGVCPLPLLRV